RRHYQGTFAQNLGKLKENPPVESTPSAQFNIGGAKRIPHFRQLCGHGSDRKIVGTEPSGKIQNKVLQR
ncbi:MAG: hypothetical protein FWE95_04625, partial [Planctomycetaceae bacterium]|nr:hypothetical protein [Planctomycetaceae bacterium]